MEIGFLGLPLSGHLNPMTALARKLQSRGNETVFITNRSYQARACRMQKVISKTHGLDLAADLIDKALGITQPQGAELSLA